MKLGDDLEKIWLRNCRFFGGILDGKILKVHVIQLCYRYQKLNLQLASYQGRKIDLTQSFEMVIYSRWRVTPAKKGKDYYVFVPEGMAYYDIKELLHHQGLIIRELNYRY